MVRPTESAPIALRLREAAKLLGISERTLWVWAQEGRVPCRPVRTGNRTIWLFSPDELRRWAAGDPQPEAGR